MYIWLLLSFLLIVDLVSFYALLLYECYISFYKECVYSSFVQYSSTQPKITSGVPLYVCIPNTLIGNDSTSEMLLYIQGEHVVLRQGKFRTLLPSMVTGINGKKI